MQGEAGYPRTTSDEDTWASLLKFLGCSFEDLDPVHCTEDDFKDMLTGMGAVQKAKTMRLIRERKTALERRYRDREAVPEAHGPRPPVESPEESEEKMDATPWMVSARNIRCARDMISTLVLEFAGI
jgi:hypothetical protein